MSDVPARENTTAYKAIDLDPHFTRVVRYFRPSDYVAWGAVTASGPAFVLGFERINPTYTGPAGVASMLRYATLLGACAGFMFAYQRSSLRFWGWTENQREYEKDLREMRQRVREGKPLYGAPSQPEYAQQASSWHSKFAALKFAAYPWFNFANHNQHGVDTSRYYEDTDSSK
ncbi:5269_t:CDS:2 [Paraglomus occultum]|uniref:5269_t:CDS:1 n=1 Tax=Paraglomus occultum TaxID=144539 RepID=A0A9N8VI39_9GLOM|nr:5269_t:CDS:2 [Paraglomus occultum]